MTFQVTSMSRTFSTSVNQREVIHAQGHSVSNQNSTFLMGNSPLQTAYDLLSTLHDKIDIA